MDEDYAIPILKVDSGPEALEEFAHELETLCSSSPYDPFEER